MMEAIGINIGYLIVQLAIFVVFLAALVIGLRAIIRYINKD